MEWNFQYTYTDLPKIYYSKVKPDILENPKLLLFNNDLANKLNLETNNNEKEICDFLLGKKNNNKKFFSQAYAGHQFGNFTILGDGRALLLGEHISQKNERFDIQLKGSGKTPYSRNGDGKATIGSMIREYLVSEAMYYLGIPTTRALAVITTGEKILRENFEQGAILVRVANSHLRVGTFQFGSLLRNTEDFNNLISYTINRLYPEIENTNKKYLIFFKKICEKQIDLIIEWMRVGFIHGVMNTDNMSLSGETIDYGPCAFMDNYNPKTVFSSIDKMGRYSFENQSKITLWNLARFAETFIHLIDNNEKNAIEIIEDILKQNKDRFEKNWLNMMCKKLNLHKSPDNKILVDEFLDIMHVYKLDYTNSFIELEDKKLEKNIFKNWQKKYSLINKNNYKRVNPIIIPRNHIIEKIILQVKNNNISDLDELIKSIKEPYNKKLINSKFTIPPLESEKVYQTFCGT